MNAGRKTIWIYALSALTLIPAGQIRSGENDDETLAQQAFGPAPPLVEAAEVAALRSQPSDGGARVGVTDGDEREALQIPADPTVVHKVGLSCVDRTLQDTDWYLEPATCDREATRSHPMRQELPIVIHSSSAESMAALLAGRILALVGLLPLAAFVEAETVALPAIRLSTDQTSVVYPLADDLLQEQ